MATRAILSKLQKASDTLSVSLVGKCLLHWTFFDQSVLLSISGVLIIDWWRDNAVRRKLSYGCYILDQ